MSSGHGVREVALEAKPTLGQGFSCSDCLEFAFHPPKIRLQRYCWSQADITCTQLGLICCRVVGNINSFFGQKKISHSMIKQEVFYLIDSNGKCMKP